MSTRIERCDVGLTKAEVMQAGGIVEALNLRPELTGWTILDVHTLGRLGSGGYHVYLGREVRVRARSLLNRRASRTTNTTPRWTRRAA